MLNFLKTINLYFIYPLIKWTHFILMNASLLNRYFLIIKIFLFHFIILNQIPHEFFFQIFIFSLLIIQTMINIYLI